MLLANRHLERHDRAGEMLAQRLQRLVEIGVLTIHLVDHHEAWETSLVQVAPGQFGADFRASHRVHHHQTRVCHGHGRNHVAGKIGVARRVKQVDLGALPFAGNHRGVDRNMAPFLFVIPVRHSGAIFYTTEARGRTRIKKHGLAEGGLTATAVPNQRDVADIFRRISPHQSSIGLLVIDFHNISVLG